MDELEQKLSAEHLDLYRHDGRNYDLSEDDGVLTLRLRRSVRLERALVAVLAMVLSITFFVVCFWMDKANWGKNGVTISLSMLTPLQFGTGFVIAMRRGEIWKFDRSAANVCCNTLEIANFAKIRGVRAWRRGSRFYLALQLKFGQTAKLGRFAFSRSERAWRQDATQIAMFLGVPLEIPPV